MKKLFLITTLLIALVTASKQSSAQVRVGVNINIGNQPVWGPTGYDYVDYYYLPDIDAYYYVPQRQFIYLSGNRWVFSASLPPRYRGYDLYSGYKVVINEPRPYLRNDFYRNRYSGYRGRHDQEIIRYSNDQKYKNHGRGWDRDERNRGRGRGRGRGNRD